jgi:S1-C subfamily serine protease
MILFRVLLGLLLFGIPSTQVVNVKLAQKTMDVSVLIRMKQYQINKDGTIERGLGGCSGTYVSGHTVLTAAHCFDLPTTDTWVRGTDNVSHRATLLKLDAGLDLALLDVSGVKDHKFAVIAKGVKVGEHVTNVGSPFRFEFLVSEGIVSAFGFKDKHFKSTYMITTAMINAGSSGGGAFNINGELLGVNTMSVGFFGWTGISMAVDLPSIHTFMGGLLWL